MRLLLLLRLLLEARLADKADVAVVLLSLMRMPVLLLLGRRIRVLSLVNAVLVRVLFLRSRQHGLRSTCSHPMKIRVDVMVELLLVVRVWRRVLGRAGGLVRMLLELLRRRWLLLLLLLRVLLRLLGNRRRGRRWLFEEVMAAQRQPP